MYNHNSNENIRTSFETQMENDTRLIAEKQARVKDLNYEIDLVKGHFVNLLKSYDDPLQHCDLFKLWRDFDWNTRKLKYDAKDSKDLLSYIEDVFFFEKGVKRKLLSIVQTDVSYEFLYKIGRKTLYINVPVYSNATTYNYHKLKYELMDVKNSTYTVVYSTYFIEYLPEQIKKYLEIANEDSEM